MRKSFAISLFVFVAFPAVFFGISSVAYAATTVSGTLSGDTVWTKAGSPYVIYNVVIPKGASLTVEPGTVVKVQNWGAWAMYIYGSLSVGGSDPDTEKAVFTSIADDTVAGDTNNDGSKTAPPSRGDWYGIYVAAGGTAAIQNAAFRYGGYNIYASVYNQGGQVSVSHSEFSFSNHSIIALDGTTEAYDNAFHDNDEYALWQKGGTLRFGGNTFSDNNLAVLLADGTFRNDGGNGGEGGIHLRNRTLSGDTAFSKDGLPYVINNIIVPQGASLVVQPGAILKALNTNWALYSYGTLTVGSENAEPVVITSIADDTVGGDTNNDGSATAPAKGDWCGIHLAKGTADFIDISLRYGGCPVSGQLNNYGAAVTVGHSRFSESAQYHIRNTAGQLTLTDSELTRGEYGLGYDGGSVVMHDNSIHDNAGYGVINTSSSQTVIDATNNWWGDPSGPYHGTANPNGKGNKVSNFVLFDPWLGYNPICTEKCYSNVMFLPGIKASRLYKDGTMGTEDRLWLPNYFGSDLEDLAMDSDGKSKNEVYTRDILDEIALPVVGGNIYKSFMDDLATLKSDKTINDYNLFAYDWRQNVENVATNGTLYENGEIKSAIAELEALATSSKSKKVTIVAHSNGGLLAKAIMSELEKRGLTDKVDKIVFVGTLQMGTPLAMLSLLYGYDESLVLGTLLSREEARELAENMPGAYSLLPSAKYLERMENPFITFSSSHTRYKTFLDAYGEKISTFGEFGEFLSGSGDGRSEPDSGDVDTENTLREKFLTQAKEMHERLDDWTPPSDVQVIQIAGWGLETVSGVEYMEKEKIRCDSYSSGTMPSCTRTGEYEPIYEPKFTVDGDKVVVAPSALMMPEAENVKRYWVDLHEQNKGLKINRIHRDLLEVYSVRTFVSDIITDNENAPLPKFMETSRPDDYDDARPRLRMSLYSPLDIHLYDDHGNHTGPKKITVDGHEAIVFEEGIPNSYYYQFGDRKYVGFGSGEHIRVEMDGYDTGSYTLKLQEVKPTENGDEVLTHTTFENLPTTTDTTVSFDVPEAGIVDMSPVKADIDGNGTQDYAVEPVPNGTATFDTDVVAPITTISLSGTQGQNSWYAGDVTVTLTAQDNENGSGVEKTEYSLDNGTTWNIYADPIVISAEGTTTVQFFSTDKAGNREEVKTEAIKIDKTAPEAKISFNPDTQKLDIIGMDNLSEVSVTMKNPVIPSAAEEARRKKKERLIVTALTDQSGHTTELVFEKKKDKERRIDLALRSIAYDGVKTILSETVLQYKWNLQKKKGAYNMFASHLRTADIRIESHYRSKKDVTIIMQKPEDLDDDDNDDRSDMRPTREKLSGMVIPGLMTERGNIKVNY